MAEALDALGETLGSTFEALRSKGDLPIVRYKEQTLTGKQLVSCVAWLLEAFKDKGVHKQNRVVVLLDRSCYWVPPILACLAAGVVYVPIDTEAPESRVVRQIEHVDPQAVVVAPSTEHLSPSGIPKVVLPRGPLPEDTGSIIRLATMHSTDVAYMIFTSGTTGSPRAAMISRENLANMLTALESLYHTSAHLTVGMLAPTHFDASWKCIAGVIYGHSLMIVPRDIRIDPALMREQVARHVDIIDGTPYDLVSFGEDDLTTFLVGGAAFGQTSWDYARSLKTAINVYGPTECSVFVAAIPIRDERETIGSDGVGSNRLRIVDAGLQPVTPGTIGELVIEGPSVGLGYWRDPAYTATRFMPSPFASAAGARLYKTGDLAVHRNEGISIVGRIDSERKRDGYRVNLDEIADELAAHGEVVSAVVIDVGAASARSRFVAIYTIAADASISADDLQKWLTTRLPRYALPDRYLQVGLLPRTGAGKLDRTALLRMALEDSGNQRHLGATINSERIAVTEVKRALVEIWQDVLETTVLPTDNFFDLGGDSIAAMQVAARAATVGITVRSADIFEAQTVEALAAKVLERR